MTVIREGRLEFTFPENCTASKYDDWAFYRHQFGNVADSKAVDFLCIHDECAWLVEVKDYRDHPRTKPSETDAEVAKKVRDTLAGLATARASAAGPEKVGAGRALRQRRWRVALHLEQVERPSRLRPSVADPATLRTKLQKAVKAVDPHPMVINSNSTRVPWTVRRL